MFQQKPVARQNKNTIIMVSTPAFPESKESTPSLVFTSTKWASPSDFLHMVVRQDE